MKFNNAFFEKLGTSPEVTQLCVEKAETIASDARSTAPVDTGEYRDKITVRVKRGRSRNVALVVASDDKSMLIESKHGTLARALNRAKRG